MANQEVRDYIDQVMKPHLKMFRDHDEYLIVDNIIGDFQRIMEMDEANRDRLHGAARAIETYYGNKEEIINKIEMTLEEIYS